MINPFDDFNNLKVDNNELNKSVDFINWALTHGYNLFKLSSSKKYMNKAYEDYLQNKKESVNDEI